jgi:hypothetical protein
MRVVLRALLAVMGFRGEDDGAEEPSDPPA